MACVYRYQFDGHTVYVGKSRSMSSRVRAHEYDNLRIVSDLCSIEYIDGLSDADADILETYYIGILSPPLNKSKQWGKPRITLPAQTWKTYRPSKSQAALKYRSGQILAMYLKIYFLAYPQEVLPDGQNVHQVLL